MSAQPIAVYYWPTPNGKKITIALEEMGLPYQIHPVNIGAGDQFKPSFMAISPNCRMPAIVDPDGADGAPISVFESGAILQYLGRKSGQFYPADERARIAVDEWLFWQVGGLGPMGGQANHFRKYAAKIEPDPEKLIYGKTRYTQEVGRLWGVLERRLAERDYVAGDYSVADMAIWPWISPSNHGQDIDAFPNLKAWRARVGARPGVERGKSVKVELNRPLDEESPEADAARRMLFGQGATIPKVEG